MTTDSVAGFALGWTALVVWTLATFTLLERIHPRHDSHPGVREVMLAAGLLGLNAGLAQILVIAPLRRYDANAPISVGTPCSRITVYVA